MYWYDVALNSFSHGANLFPVLSKYLDHLSLNLDSYIIYLSQEEKLYIAYT